MTSSTTITEPTTMQFIVILGALIHYQASEEMSGRRKRRRRKKQNNFHSPYLDKRLDGEYMNEIKAKAAPGKANKQAESWSGSW